MTLLTLGRKTKPLTDSPLVITPAVGNAEQQQASREAPSEMEADDKM